MVILKVSCHDTRLGMVRDLSASVLPTDMGIEMKFEHNGKIYATSHAECCDACDFFWCDGGLYDGCIHPDQELVKKTCGNEQRAKGSNVIWVSLINARNTDTNVHLHR